MKRKKIVALYSIAKRRVRRGHKRGSPIADEISRITRSHSHERRQRDARGARTRCWYSKTLSGDERHYPHSKDPQGAALSAILVPPERVKTPDHWCSCCSSCACRIYSVHGNGQDRKIALLPIILYTRQRRVPSLAHASRADEPLTVN